MKNIAIFCSGFGSNLQAIIKAVSKGKIKAKIAIVISDKVDAYALVRAKKAKIPIAFIDPSVYKDKKSYEQSVVRILEKRNIDFVILAGYMRILSEYFIKRFKDKILNVHPALLPSFKGIQGIKDALTYGVKITGVTVHFVDAKPDHGPIISQAVVKINPDDTQESLAKRIHALEHKLYPKAIQLLVKGKLKIKKRLVEIKK
ncbi:MAG: phosphoribosylglycinamide formyltransferase [Candidatus Omnitrophota bacterium]